MISNLPTLDGQWTDFANLSKNFSSDTTTAPLPGREVRVNLVYELINTIEKNDTPQLFYLHTILPHMPFVYLPSGKYYGPESTFPHGMDDNRWNESPWESIQGYQRHLLQLAFVDKLLGEIIAKLKSEQLFDETILIITGDHGESFRERTKPRGISEENLQDTLLVPLFVKLPYQDSAEISTRNVESIDILPTIAELIESDVDWEFDGQSLFATGIEKNNKNVYFHTGEIRSYSDNFPGLEASLQRKADIFENNSIDGLFAAGKYGSLVMQNTQSLLIGESASQRIELENIAQYRLVDTASDYLPAHLKGKIKTQSGEVINESTNIAISLNGIIATTTSSFETDNNWGNFTAMLPEHLFIDGVNNIDLFLIDDSDEVISLHPILFEGESVNIQPRQVISFSKNAIETKYVISGLSPPSNTFSWSDSNSVLFEFSAPGATNNLMLTAKVIPFLGDGKIPSQEVNILVNNTLIGNWNLDTAGIHEESVTIPLQLLDEDGSFVLEFDIPNAAVPKDLGVNGDARMLGIAFLSMSITPIN